MTDAAAIPKQELLIKLMKLTSSSNDGEALSALRKATDLLTAGGWDWERLIKGKIVIVEDPFAAISDPRDRGYAAPPHEPRDYTGGGAYTGRVNPTPPPPPRAAPPMTSHTATRASPFGQQSNKFAGWCWCCGVEVIALAGFIFKPGLYITNASTKWECVCTPCNTTGTARAWASARQKKRGRTAVGDLA